MIRRILLAIALIVLTWGAQADYVVNNATGQFATLPSTQPTYCTGSSGFAMVTGPNWIIQGSATKLIRLTRLDIGGTSTAAAAVQINIIKRSSAYTGGTFATFNDNAVDSLSPVGTALVQSVSTATTPGTSAGGLRSFLLDTAPTTGSPITREFVFGGNFNERAPTLRSASEWYEVNIPAPPAGGSLAIDMCWTEE